MKFTRGRYYSYDGYEYKCYGHTPSGNAVLCTDNGSSWCTDSTLGFTELPPRDGEFYEGELVEVRDFSIIEWNPATYAGKTSIGERPHLAMLHNAGNVVTSWAECRRPLPKRRVPTDEDAKKRPKCFPRGDVPRTLLAVLDMHPGGNRFVARDDTGYICCYEFCEVEA